VVTPAREPKAFLKRPEPRAFVHLVRILTNETDVGIRANRYLSADFERA
jgi:hypothetical protein